VGVRGGGGSGEGGVGSGKVEEKEGKKEFNGRSITFFKWE